MTTLVACKKLLAPINEEKAFDFGAAIDTAMVEVGDRFELT